MAMRWLCFSWALFALLAFSPPLLRAQLPIGSPPSRQWVILIGVSQHDNPSYNGGVRYTDNDVAALRQVLSERARIPGNQILELSTRNQENETKARPTLAKLRQELPQFLRSVGSADRLLVYYSGHGVVRDGAMYFVPADFNHHDPAKTGYPASELRDLLRDCAAVKKLLVLDCCHAGAADGSRGGATPEFVVDAEDQGKSLFVEQASGVAVLCSCAGGGRSWEWSDRQHGHFTYWLCRGLSGGADKTADGVLTMDEIFGYVEKRVENSVQKLKQQRQTPVRIIGADVPAEISLIELAPETPELLMRRLAEELDVEVRYKGLQKIAVAEFTERTLREQRLARATLPSYLAKLVCDSLSELSRGAEGAPAYAVVDFKKATANLGGGFPAAGIDDPHELGKLASPAVGLSGCVWGTIRHSGKKNLSVQCELWDTTQAERLSDPSGLIPNDDSLQAQFAGSNFAAPVEPAARPDSHVSDPLFAQRDVGVEIWSVGPRRQKKEVKKLVVADDFGGVKRIDYYIGARDQEQYEIHLINNTEGDVGVELFIDGLNTINQKRERLGQARPWVVPPSQPNVPYHNLAGWYLSGASDLHDGVERDAQFGVSNFRFVEISQSIAARQNFNESIGLITAAFYRSAKGSRLGTGGDPAVTTERRTEVFDRGKLLAVIQLRYADENSEEWQRLSP